MFWFIWNIRLKHLIICNLLSNFFSKLISFRKKLTIYFFNVVNLSDIIQLLSSWINFKCSSINLSIELVQSCLVQQTCFLFLTSQRLQKLFLEIDKYSFNNGQNIFLGLLKYFLNLFPFLFNSIHYIFLNKKICTIRVFSLVRDSLNLLRFSLVLKKVSLMFS